MAEHRLDLERRQRLGLVEAVWGEHKSAEQIIAIARDFQAAGELCLITRVDGAKAGAVRAAIPEVEHHQQARCLTLGAMPTPTTPAVGLLCGGSSDLTVLAEAELALHCHGISAKRFANHNHDGTDSARDFLSRWARPSCRVSVRTTFCSRHRDNESQRFNGNGYG